MTSKIIQVLGAARLSKDADESTSIERQSGGINGWADLRSNTTGDDYRVVHVSEDSDVSGAVSPFDPAGLGPYLREPLLSTWQVLVVFRLDRLTRSIADFEAIWKSLRKVSRRHEILAQNATRTGPNVNRGPLLHVAHCANCNTPLNLTNASWNGKQYRYYRCPNERLKRGCDAKRIPADELESRVESMMLEIYGTWSLTEVMEIAGIDYSTQMHELAEAIGDGCGSSGVMACEEF